MDTADWRAGWDMINAHAWGCGITKGYNPDLSGVAPTYQDAMLRYYPMEERMVRANKIKDDFGPNATWRNMREHYYPRGDQKRNAGEQRELDEAQRFEEQFARIEAEAALESRAPTPGLGYSDAEETEELEDSEAMSDRPLLSKSEKTGPLHTESEAVNIDYGDAASEPVIASILRPAQEKQFTASAAQLKHGKRDTTQGSKVLSDPVEFHLQTQDNIPNHAHNTTIFSDNFQNPTSLASIADYEREYLSTRMTSSPEQSISPNQASSLRKQEIDCSEHAAFVSLSSESGQPNSQIDLCQKDTVSALPPRSQNHDLESGSALDMPIKLSNGWHQGFDEALVAQGADEQETAIIKEAIHDLENIAELKEIAVGTDAVEVKDSDSTTLAAAKPAVPFSIFNCIAFDRTTGGSNKKTKNNGKKIAAKDIVAYTDEQFLAMKWEPWSDRELDLMDASKLRLTIRSIKALTRFFNGVSKKETIARIKDWQNGMKRAIAAQEAATEEDQGDEEGASTKKRATDSNRHQNKSTFSANIKHGGNAEMKSNRSAAHALLAPQNPPPPSMHPSSSAIVPQSAKAAQENESPALNPTTPVLKTELPFNRSSSLSASDGRNIFLDPDAPPRDSPLTRKFHGVRLDRDNEKVGAERDSVDKPKSRELENMTDAVNFEFANAVAGNAIDQVESGESDQGATTQLQLSVVGKKDKVKQGHDPSHNHSAHIARSTRPSIHQAEIMEEQEGDEMMSATGKGSATESDQAFNCLQSAAAEHKTRGTKRTNEEPNGTQSSKRTLRSASTAPSEE